MIFGRRRAAALLGVTPVSVMRPVIANSTRTSMSNALTARASWQPTVS